MMRLIVQDQLKRMTRVTSKQLARADEDIPLKEQDSALQRSLSRVADMH